MLLSLDGKYLITSDKDEHIRISHYPEVYDILCYCFGHTEFVSGLQFLPTQPELLISGGGDGSLRLWHWQTGKQVDSFQFEGTQETTEDALTVIPLAVSTTHLVAVAIEGKPILQLFRVESSKLQKTETITLESPPLCAFFDSNSRLWVSSASATQLLKVFIFDANSKGYIPLPPSDPVTPVLQTINDTCSISVERPVYDTTVRDLSKDLQFRKRRGEDNEEEEGDANLGENQGADKKGKKKERKNRTH